MNLGELIRNLVACFIDCNCLPADVTGGGPSEDGANAARYVIIFNYIIQIQFFYLLLKRVLLIRWDENIQRAFYNGWKSIHGLKHQTLNDAFGVCPDMCGPTSLRRNDLTLLRISNVVQRFADMQLGEAIQFIIMGDSAYKKQHHLTSYHKAEDNIPDYLQWNLAMKQVRISIEWDYGHTAALFKYVGRKDKLKLLKGKIVSRIYTVATILRNIHAGIYGSQTSNYFGVELPDDYVERYLTQTDFV